MKPYNPGGHAAYQKKLEAGILKYYPDPNRISSRDWEIIDRFYNLDLSEVDVTMSDCYSVFGPLPRCPSDMLRSELAALEFKIPSHTQWAAHLKTNPLYALVSGFSPRDTPGVGTFYDFDKRLWLSDSDNLSPHEHLPKPSVKAPKKTGEKADPIEPVTVEDLLKQYQEELPSANQPYTRLFDIYKKHFLDGSVSQGLIDPEDLSLAGDGTPVYTSARERSRTLKDDEAVDAPDRDKLRYYSQPDCDIGWDSSRKTFYSGYDLYLLTASDSVSDLPVFPLLSPASRHDSLGFLHTYFAMRSFLPEYKPKRILLDSAHDAMPIYEYFFKEDITPFIDLNARHSAPFELTQDITIGKDGIPQCKAGLKMTHDGTEKKKHRAKYRCPYAWSSVDKCPYSADCCRTKYGRVVHTATKDNPRLFNVPARESKEWKSEYKRRTSAERDNKCIKDDLLLENGSHLSSKMWYCRLYRILMCRHLNAWDISSENSLHARFQNIA